MAAKHTRRYLQGTKTLDIRYTRDLNRLRSRGHDLKVMYGLLDSDFAGCKDTTRSTSGYIVLLNGGPIEYYSGRQSTLALCTTMAETIALAEFWSRSSICLPGCIICRFVRITESTIVCVIKHCCAFCCNWK